MNDPIIIISMPRSGSSMTAGLFAEHGVWTGPCRPPGPQNAKGHFESLPIRDEIIKTVGAIVQKGVLAPEVKGWRGRVENIIRKAGYKEGPWLFKSSAMYYPLWHEFNPTFVCVRRNLEAIEQSGKATGYFRRPKAIQPHVKAMDYVRDNMGGIDVFSDEVIAGDYSSLERAFDAAGLEMDERIVSDFVDPSLWHYKQGLK